MIRRIMQVCRALRAQITTADKLFIDKYLTAEQKKLFMQMNTYDKKHALNTAYSAEKLMTGKADINKKKLLKAALLHDIARTADEIILSDKIIFVLIRAISKNLLNYIAADNARGFLSNRRGALYICEHHAEIAANKLEELQEQEIADIVRRHHWPAQKNDSLELKLLRQADELN